MDAVQEIQKLREYLSFNQMVLSISGAIISILLILVGHLTSKMISEIKLMNEKQNDKIEEMRMGNEIESKKLAVLERQVNIIANNVGVKIG